MADLLALWHAEHAKFGRLLNLLEEQIAAFHRGEEPNYELMSDIVHYLRDYADTCHHPREDLGFARLITKDPSSAQIVEQLTQEHRVIAGAGRELAERLSEVDAGVVFSRATIERAAATYLVYYRQHLVKEESEVLPRIQRLFTPRDWAEVEAAMSQGDDPLFGARVDAKFKELRRRITREAGPTQN